MSNERNSSNFRTKYWNKSNKYSKYKPKILKSFINRDVYGNNEMKYVQHSNKFLIHRNSSPSPSYLENDSDYESTITKAKTSITTQWSGSYISHGEADRRRITGLTSKSIIYLEPESLKFQERYLERIAFQNVIKRNHQKQGICAKYPMSFILDCRKLEFQSVNSVMEYMKQFEKTYKIPLLSHLWDTIGLLLLQCNILSFNRLYWDDIIKDIIINVPALKKYVTKILEINKEIEQNRIINFAVNSVVGKWFTCAYDMFNKFYGHIPIGTEIKYKLNGIWQIHVEIISALNKHIETEVTQHGHWHKNGIELHIRFWVNGLVKTADNCNENDENKIDVIYDDSSSDDDDDICYNTSAVRDTIDEYYNGIINSYANIKDIGKLMKIQKQLKLTIIEQDKNELLYPFTIRVFEHKSSEPELFEAVMMLFDTSNPVSVVAYIWKRKLNYYKYRPFDYDLSDLRIKSKEYKHFEFIYNNEIIDVGKYVGMDIFILNESSIHSYWTVFDKSIRFISSHVNTIWREYYKYDTLYEKKCQEFAHNINEFEEYVKNNSGPLHVNNDVYVVGETEKTKIQIIDLFTQRLTSQQRGIRDFEPAKFRQFWYNATGCRLLNWGRPPRNGYFFLD